MLGSQVTPFFTLCRVKVVKQKVGTSRKIVTIEVTPNKHYVPVCHKCHSKVKRIHSPHRRTIRGMDIFGAKSFITVEYRRLRWPHVDSHIIPTKILGLIQIISHPSTKSLYHYPFPESPKAFHF
jgi:transposase